MEKKYSLIIFDLDGTLIDSSEGIINDHNYVAKLYGKKELNKEEYGRIGGSLPDSFIEKYGLSKEETVKATEIYRTRYNENGIFEAVVYDGIPELLQELKEHTCKTAVATFKAQSIAQKMLEHFNISKYFDMIRGVDNSDNIVKVDLLIDLINEFNVDKSRVVLIGDSASDAKDAKEVGIDFCGVSFGLGYKTIEEIKCGYYTNAVSTTEELRKIL